MKFQNSTHWDDRFLRRMLAWVCSELGFKYRRLRTAEFRNRAVVAYSGRAYSGSSRIKISIGPASRFPCGPDNRPGMGGIVFGDQLEALVAITAHEIWHLVQYRDQRAAKLKQDRRFERDARWHECQVLLNFRAVRESLVSCWSQAIVQRSTLKLSVPERRAAKARQDLVRWQRRLKTAQTKIKKLKKKVAYYDNKLAVE